MQKKKYYKHWRIEILDANNDTLDVDYVPTKREAMKIINRKLKDENLWQINLENERVNYWDFGELGTDIIDVDNISEESFKGKAQVKDRIDRAEEAVNDIVYKFLSK